MTFKKNMLVIPLLICVSLLSACWFQPPDTPLFQSSAILPYYKQASFKDYINDTRQWLQENRVFLTDQNDIEIDANTPYEIAPTGQNATRKGVLLVHGLGDSPFYLRDIAHALSERGFLVRTVLLPGHGTQPADLLLPTFDDWQDIVAHHSMLLSTQVDEVWLGGVSTGANLVTAYAADNDSIQGLLLFSPAFVPKDSLYFLSPFVHYFMDWLDIDPHENNYTRYATLATNGAVLFSKSVTRVNDVLSTQTYDKPVLIAISEHDSVINSAKVA